MSERKKGAGTKHKAQTFESQVAVEGEPRSNAFDSIRDMASALTPVAEVRMSTQCALLNAALLLCRQSIKHTHRDPSLATKRMTHTTCSTKTARTIEGARLSTRNSIRRTSALTARA